MRVPVYTSDFKSQTSPKGCLTILILVHSIENALQSSKGDSTYFDAFNWIHAVKLGHVHMEIIFVIKSIKQAQLYF